MGREVRRVRADWKHPRDERGDYIPLHGRPFLAAWTEWEIGRRRWKAGLRHNFHTGEMEPKTHQCSWTEWQGAEPKEADYMPPEAFGKRFMMYEDTTEGTPVHDRVALSAGTLAGLLAADGSSRWGSTKAGAEEWLAIIQGRAFGGLMMLLSEPDEPTA